MSLPLTRSEYPGRVSLLPFGSLSRLLPLLFIGFCLTAEVDWAEASLLGPLLPFVILPKAEGYLGLVFCGLATVATRQSCNSQPETVSQ